MAFRNHGLSLLLASMLSGPVAAQGQTGFNPDLSVILSGTAAHLSNDPDRYSVSGFSLGPETGPGRRGLSIAESELIASANVDDRFFGRLTVAVTPQSDVELEEAFVQTLSLSHGFTVRAGRFFSGIGYLNSQHPHTWDFVDAALPYRALLANQYRDDGVRVSWVAPTDLFVELGGEWLRGAHYPAGGDRNDGQGVVAAYVRVGGDFGASHAWRVGLSGLRGRAVGRESGDVENAPDAFSGDSRVAIAEFVWKWSPLGNPRERNAKFQAEYLWRDESGTFTADVDGVNGTAVRDAYRATQSGWYTQAVWQFLRSWRVGARYDRLRSHEIDAGANAALFDSAGHTPRRVSVMLDWSYSEFSRLRLQWTGDRSRPDTGSELFLQYIMSLGAHGAHSF